MVIMKLHCFVYIFLIVTSWQRQPDAAFKHAPNYRRFLTRIYWVRLVNGTIPTEGRLEIFHKGRWGDVCNHGWGSGEAKVVCRMLGESTYHPKVIEGSKFGTSHRQHAYIIHGCHGTESDLRDCQKIDWGNHKYDTHCHGSVGVRCDGVASTSSTTTTSSKPPTTSQHRITTPTTSKSRSTTTPETLTTTRTTSKLPTTSHPSITTPSPFKSRTTTTPHPSIRTSTIFKLFTTLVKSPTTTTKTTILPPTTTTMVTKPHITTKTSNSSLVTSKWIPVLQTSKWVTILNKGS